MMKKINLFMDDLREGPSNQWVGAEVGWEDWVVTRSVENTKWLLEMGVVNHLSLDHDMGDNSKTGAKNEDGTALVIWMIETNTWPEGNITIHSANIGRALWMKEMIDKHRPSSESTLVPDP